MYWSLLLIGWLQVWIADRHDTTAMHGDWVPVKAELGGQPLPDAVLKSIQLKIGPGTYEVMVNGKLDSGTVELDPSATPKAMTIHGQVGPNQGKTIPAIYEFDGQTLRVCYNLGGSERPQEFKTTAGSSLYLVSYARKK